MSHDRDGRPLIAHVVYRFDVGGLENGLVNLINHMPRDAYRHAVISLTEVTDFRHRVVHDDVQFIALGKGPGHALKLYPRLHALFRELRPAIVHSRNLAALETVVPAWAAGVPIRIHGEHGRDMGDLDGSSRKYQWVRRTYRPFVTRYIALSQDLERYLCAKVGVPRERISQIYNGVDAARFRPVAAAREPIDGCPFVDPGLWLVGTVGRMEPVKDPLNLVRGFLQALQLAPSKRARMRLLLIGDGALYSEARALLESAGLAELAWMPGERRDIPAILRGLDCFVLPSLAEGISNTILEAMASGLPVIATDVGGNSELVETGRTGEIIPSADPLALASRMLAYARDPKAAR
ncbi:MAG TPA: TIGR03088 family PEP-CTERM/XrtA system glycosyltransferase, partial [Casimicrobiaceae bacterium]|nr:TIGR03088 family PEP-CTERM/XrtA system glycosyltransferase [Casimicrobiaceae bacterium]